MLRRAAEGFAAISRGYNKRQRDASAAAYFFGVAQGAKLAHDPDLERVVREWIATKLRPLGHDAAVMELVVEREDGIGKADVREDGYGDGAAGGRTHVTGAAG